MSLIVLTGSGGLIGSESVRFFHSKGFDVVGVDNDMRAYFFGSEGSTSAQVAQLNARLPRYQHHSIDIRNTEAVDALFRTLGKQVLAIIHTAAQPSHDWAAREPFTDFQINANGTLNMLEAARRHCPDAVFIFTSTNKVYGDSPNHLPLLELPTRWEIDPGHPFHDGIDESMSIDQCKHSLFGASKVAADVLVQEYGRYFGLRTCCFRGGCLTGPAHSGAEMHGFLAYLAKCVVTGKPYKIYGYKGKQVRDNIHSFDLVSAFWHVFQNPRIGEVYNLGGGRHSNCSMLEAIAICEELSGRQLTSSYVDENRSGDHIWWISSLAKFQEHYPTWRQSYDLRRTLTEIIQVYSDARNPAP